MDRELPPEVIRKGRVRKVIITAGILLILLVFYLILKAYVTPSLDRAKIRTSIAEIGTIEATVSASGVVVPEYEQIITSPVGSTIEAIYLKSGDSVRAGQSILLLNKELLQNSLEKLKDELKVQRNKKEQLSLDTEKRLIDLQTSYEIKELQTRFVQSQYDRTKRLLEIGGAATEDLERAALDVEIVNRELNQLAQQIDNQKTSLVVALEGLDLQISIQENRISENQRQLNLAECRAGGDGVVTFVNEGLGSSVNAGDIVARVADLSRFRVEASISDIHADNLRPGGTVVMRIGDKKLRGRIANIRPAVQNGVITFIIDPENKSDKALRPNLRADIYVVTSYKENVLRVENGTFYNGLVDQEVFVVQGDKAICRIVDIGVSNFDYVELKGEIAAGDEVIVSDMRKYRHMDEIEIQNGMDK